MAGTDTKSSSRTTPLLIEVITVNGHPTEASVFCLLDVRFDIAGYEPFTVRSGWTKIYDTRERFALLRFVGQNERP